MTGESAANLEEREVLIGFPTQNSRLKRARAELACTADGFAKGNFHVTEIADISSCRERCGTYDLRFERAGEDGLHG
jgi:hypothetical protein